MSKSAVQVLLCCAHLCKTKTKKWRMKWRINIYQRTKNIFGKSSAMTWSFPYIIFPLSLRFLSFFLFCFLPYHRAKSLVACHTLHPSLWWKFVAFVDATLCFSPVFFFALKSGVNFCLVHFRFSTDSDMSLICFRAPFDSRFM